MPFGSLDAGEFGTYFIGYAATPSVTELMLRHMFLGDPPGNYDRILDFSTAVTGSLFFVPTSDFLDDPPPLPATAGDVVAMADGAATDEKVDAVRSTVAIGPSASAGSTPLGNTGSVKVGSDSRSVSLRACPKGPALVRGTGCAAHPSQRRRRIRRRANNVTQRRPLIGTVMIR